MRQVSGLVPQEDFRQTFPWDAQHHHCSSLLPCKSRLYIGHQRNSLHKSTQDLYHVQIKQQLANTKKNQVKHPSDVHLLKFVGKSLHFTKCPFGSSKYLDKFSFTGHCKSWTSPTCAMADWRNWLGKYSCGTSSSASLPSPDQVKHDEGKQKTGRTRWLFCERFKIQTNSDVYKQVVMLQKTPKNYSYNPTITTWAWLQVFVMLALENKSQAAGRIAIPGTASISQKSLPLTHQNYPKPKHTSSLSQQNPVGNVSGTSAGRPRCLGFNPPKAQHVWWRDRRETSLPQISALMEPPATRTANHLRERNKWSGESKVDDTNATHGVSLRLCDPSFYGVWPYLCRIGK